MRSNVSMGVLCALAIGVVGSLSGVEAQAAEVVLRDTPCRLYDSRNVGGLGSGSKISSSTGATIETADPALDTISFTANSIDYNYQGGEAGCRVPASATGAVINLTAFQPDSSGWARLWSYGSPEPLSTSINVTNGQLNEATGLMVKLGTAGKVSLSALISTSHYVVDLVGHIDNGPRLLHFSTTANAPFAPGAATIGLRLLVMNASATPFIGHDSEWAIWNGTDWEFSSPLHGDIGFESATGNIYRYDHVLGWKRLAFVP